MASTTTATSSTASLTSLRRLTSEPALYTMSSVRSRSSSGTCSSTSSPTKSSFGRVFRRFRQRSSDVDSDDELDFCCPGEIIEVSSYQLKSLPELPPTYAEETTATSRRKQEEAAALEAINDFIMRSPRKPLRTSSSTIFSPSRKAIDLPRRRPSCLELARCTSDSDLVRSNAIRGRSGSLANSLPFLPTTPAPAYGRPASPCLPSYPDEDHRN